MGGTCLCPALVAQRRRKVFTMVSFTEAVKLGYQNYFNFSDRSTRAELWWWILFLAAVTLGAAVFGATMHSIFGQLIPGVSLTLIGLILFYVVTIIPTLSNIIRRLEAVKLGYQRYFDFKGRSTRAEFWSWILFLTPAVILGAVLFRATGATEPSDFAQLGPGLLLALLGLNLFYVATLIPTLSIIIRRLHDIDKSVFWLVLLIIPWGQFVFLYFLLRPSAGPKGSMQTLDEFLAQTSNLNTYEKGLKFELYCKTLLEASGHHVVHSGQSGDRGIDLRATLDGVVTVIQCKHQESVAAAVVIQTFGMLHAENAGSGCVITTGRFTDDAKKFGSEHPEMELIDRSELSKLVNQVPRTEPRAASPVIEEILNLAELSGIFASGLTQADSGDHRRAISDFTKAIELDPEDTRYYSSRGASFNFLGEYDKAITDATKAIGLDPESVQGYTTRAGGYLALGEYDKAITDATKAIGLDPESSIGYSFRSTSYGRLGAFNKSISDATKAITLNPDNASYYHVRGVSYHNVKEYEKAISDYTKAIELDPENAYHYSTRGTHYAGLKEDDKAISDFTKAIELDPDNARYYSSRGASYERLEEYDEAISDATKAIELDSEDADSYSTRGSSYDKLGAHEKAISDYTKALELDPEDDNGKISDRVRQLRDSA